MSKVDMKTVLSLLLVPAAFLLPACQTTGFEKIRGEQAAVEARLPQNWQTALEQGTIPQSWASLFDDPMLQKYMAAAQLRNSDVARAIIRVRQAEASLKDSQAVLFPILRTNAQISGLTGFDDFSLSDTYSNGLSASWSPGLFGRNDIEIKNAESLLDVSLANKERVRRVVMAQVARAYIQIIETDYQLQLAKDNLEFIGETLRISEARFKAGDIARDQYALAQLETSSAEASVIALELSARNLRRSLALLIGEPADSELNVAATLPRPASLSLSRLPAEVIGRRFDVTASRARIASAFSNLQQAERLNWPSVSLSGGLSGGGVSSGDFFNIDDYLANLSGALAATLFDGGRKDAQIDLSRYGIDAALVDYDEVLREAMREVESGFDRISAARRSLLALERGSSAANKALELEKIKYDLGESIILDVLTVQRRVNSILASYISTQRRLLDAQIDTYLALGGEPPSSP